MGTLMTLMEDADVRRINIWLNWENQREISEISGLFLKRGTDD
jgi:uncharacterized protein involved in tellurium resistance